MTVRIAGDMEVAAQVRRKESTNEERMMRIDTHRLSPPLFAGLVGYSLLIAGCTSGGGGDGEEDDHSNIVLLDRLGNPLLVASTEPYSPRQTCGPCHDVDAIANGYHFQQGRTDRFGDVQTTDDFFGDGRIWLKSDGMYGKW
ncbi:MAG: hypothetical protein AB1726_14355 [Planctomycetota bacterium]